MPVFNDHPAIVSQNPEEKLEDPFFGKATRCKCHCCEKCWFFHEGSRAGTCWHGGPYYGYYEV